MSAQAHGYGCTQPGWTSTQSVALDGVSILRCLGCGVTRLNLPSTTGARS